MCVNAITKSTFLNSMEIFKESDSNDIRSLCLNQYGLRPGPVQKNQKLNHLLLLFAFVVRAFYRPV